MGIPLTDIGTVSDKFGTFKLNIDSILNNQRLYFSCVGYQDTSIVISSLTTTDDNILYLKKKIYGLSEVVIKPRGKLKTIGTRCDKVDPVMQSGRYSLTNRPNSRRNVTELSVLIQNNKPLELIEINLPVVLVSCDSVVGRINIYQVNGKLKYAIAKPQDVKGNEYWSGSLEDNNVNEYLNNPNLVNVSQEPIYFTLTKRIQDDGCNPIDLTPYDLSVDGDFLIGIEILHFSGAGKIEFRTKSGKFYLRNQKYATLVEFPLFTIPITVEAYELND